MAIIIEDDCLSVNGKVVLTEIPENVVFSPAPSGSVFLGASSPTPGSRLVFTLGALKGYKFLSLFRFKIWWMMPRIGTSASDLRPETQLLLLEVKDNCTFYILILPVLEGAFRSSLQGTQTNELQFCLESGDPDVQTAHVSESVFVNFGENPYELIKNSIKILAEHKGTFNHVDDKKLPAHLDWFGWCTWDAFYREVNPEGIRQGFESLSQGGFTPRFLVIDDGWQDTYNEFQNEAEKHSGSSDFGFATRLRDIKENDKFRYLNSTDEYTTLPEFFNFLKMRYGLKCIYVWHAVLGCWGGVLPSSEALQKYSPKLVHPVQSPGNVGNLRDVAMDGIEKYGMGVIDPEKISDFYSDYHNYLASIGVDGVKVDIQNVVETIGSGYGGRVRMTSIYLRGLEEAVEKNFGNNNLICSMSHNTDSLFSSKKSAVARAYEDFMPREPTFQTVHIAGVSFNSLILGELVQPDWDMFQSLHYAADFHAASRAIGGCGVYVSDKPGSHDFEILKRLVLSDGSILRARFAGRPTRDCLFIDPVMDGESLLKIWNLNNLSGVIGVFNCQGVGTWPLTENTLRTSIPELLSGKVSPQDVEFLEEVAGDKWLGDCAVYGFNSGSLTIVSKDGKVDVSLGKLSCELFTVSPVRAFENTVHFAPIGLIDMYNSGGAVETLESREYQNGSIVKIRTRGNGRFGAYSRTKPRHCTVDTATQDFTHSSEDGLLIIKLEGESQVKDIEFVY
ncbi:putative galactinol--sucrose galactosyltransferase 2 [Silene latifolia]|uniref:putative galactinol--sucrose galactosyltransferase 2 n=1 Tax=Silene latifolia TaxID=37657 RepID=UPI003D776A65